ncbi:hypothetical protein Ddye_029391 [Dipteronia dyeriana]|uniref:Alcohol dehydrogenase-like C-terminal domain-containing protein n=1 Tax=Dipteronia dyeriana TaxID=168575 RepID=A0AAD9TEB9_9ROSI|nr:hypothetical protein Ddye_029391 [Dipteronia dyeriana]
MCKKIFVEDDRKYNKTRNRDSWIVKEQRFSGLTAYAELFDICKPKKGEKVFVSAASGSVGNLVGQYAKLFGCYVVGSARSNEKVTFWDQFQTFDCVVELIEYLSLIFQMTHVALLKEKWVLNFDDAFNYNEETDLMASLKSLITLTDAGKRAAPDMLDVVYKRIKIQGFLVADHMNVYQDFLQKTCDQLSTGEIQALEDISNGVERRLFETRVI